MIIDWGSGRYDLPATQLGLGNYWTLGLGVGEEDNSLVGQWSDIVRIHADRERTAIHADRRRIEVQG